ncbi:LOW QUALITY PROTEIN: choline transporter-like protein 1 [Dermacentor silvarum]|uniref:LOW QUALITY PROTEIN: choline transporter-like protein 1 n=1 Tax=Dermacentor silvarum TaxID=543639 RepID=UPI002101C740|nr:LOW QUALITY PROTEIN: choline transporter-like protein 1 [Dermacentor silvarum]
MASCTCVCPQGVLLSWAVRKGGDPLRLLHGVDSQGNVCGRGDQQPLPGVPGSGQNTTGLTLLVLEDALGRKRHCAASCPPGYRQTVFRRCVLDSGPVGLVHRTLNVSGAVIEEVVQDLVTCRRELGYMGLVAIGLSVAALLLLRYCVALLVWLLLVAVSLGCVGGTFYLWFSWNARRRSAQPNAGAWLVAAVAGTTAMVLLMLTVLVLRKRIQLASPSLRLQLRTSLQNITYTADWTKTLPLWNQRQQSKKLRYTQARLAPSDNFSSSSLSKKKKKKVHWYLAIPLSVCVNLYQNTGRRVCFASLRFFEHSVLFSFKTAQSHGASPLMYIIPRSQMTALFGEAGKALAAMPGLLLQPAWTLCFCAVTAVAGASAMLVLLTAGDAAVTKDTEDDSGGHVTVLLKQDSLLRLGPWYLALAVCWMLQLAVSCQEVVVAGAAADWYFHRGRCTGWSAQCASLWRLVRYHLGSVLLGSLLVALARVLRLACRLASRHCRRPGKAACCLCSCCCVGCIAALRFLNRNAFIMLAARGYSLCRAAQEAWQLLSRNALRVATVNCVGDFVLLLAKAAVVVGTTLTGQKLTQDKAGQLLWGQWVPLTAGALGSFLVAHCFLSVYEMTLDTLFLCFCHQCDEIGRGGVATIAVPDALAAFVEKSGSVAPPTARQ